MSEVEKMSIELPRAMTEMVRDAVKSGRYATASEVISQALRDWDKYDRAKAAALEDMRSLIQEGIDSGPGEEWNAEKFKQELHAEFAAINKLRETA